MIFLHLALLILGGILALSAFIVSKKPNAKATIDKLVPFQAFIGVGLLAVSLINWIRIGIIDIFRLLKYWPLGGIALIAAVFSGILLGALFGMPQIAKWIPGESSAEAKAVELSKKVAPIQMILGVIALVAGFLLLLMELGILKPG
ncbi:MAG: hypothetical protein M4D80_35810 [Myxococcota bacterium]|nr:hypothetical protein [Myxococcota bacterium]